MVALTSLHLGTLQKLGLDSVTRDAIRKSIDASTADTAKVTPYDYVPIEIIRTHAEKLGNAKVVSAAIDRAITLADSKTIVAKQQLGDYPTLAISRAPDRVLAPGAGTVSKAQLQSFAANLEAFFTALEKDKKLPAGFDPKKDPLDAATLLEILREHGGRLSVMPSYSTGLSYPRLLELQKIVASAAIPAHTERDGLLRFDSRFTKLAGKDEIEVHHKRQYEGFAIRRTSGDGDNSGFILRAHKQDRVVVSLPKGHSLLLVDHKGNECAGGFKPIKQTFDGKERNTIEVTRGLVDDKPFTIQVLDATGTPAFTQSFAFDAKPSWHSEPVLKGTFGYQSLGGAEKTDALAFAVDQGIPNGSANKIPLGRRPSFTIGEGKNGIQNADRLLIHRDGEPAFPIDDLALLLAPPQPQAFKANGVKGAAVTYELREESRHHRALDEKREGLGVEAVISQSDGKTITFEPELHQTNQARFGVRGVTISTAEGKELARFDPLDPKQDKNKR